MTDSEKRHRDIKLAILEVDLEKAYEKGQIELAAKIRRKLRRLRGDHE